MEMFLRLRVRSIPVWPFGVVSSNSSMRWRRSCQQKTVGLPSLVASARQSFRLLLTFCVVLRLVRRVFWFSAFNMARGCAAICVAWAFLRVQSSASVRHRTKAKISALGSRHAMWRAVCSWTNACELFELDLYVTMHGGVLCISCAPCSLLAPCLEMPRQRLPQLAEAACLPVGFWSSWRCKQSILWMLLLWTPGHVRAGGFSHAVAPSAMATRSALLLEKAGSIIGSIFACCSVLRLTVSVASSGARRGVESRCVGTTTSGRIQPSVLFTIFCFN